MVAEKKQDYLAISDLSMNSATRTIRIDLRRAEVASIGDVPVFVDSPLQSDGLQIVEPSISTKLSCSPTSPERQSRFSILGLLGEGAVGKVYSAMEHNCNREVAIKVLKQVEATTYDIEVKRFLREASIAAVLEHPAIIPIYELNADETGQVYLAMRKVNGQTLGERISGRENGGQFWSDMIEIFIKVCDALSFAHSQGQVHQDIKPDNIMLGSFGGVFVIDWGAASGEGDEMSLTPAYMSPEQASAQAATPGDDIYSLGATLFYCLTRRLPTNADSLEELIQKRANGVIDPIPDEVRDTVPAPLLAIALKAMQHMPANRYASMEEFAADLRNYAGGLQVSAYKDSIWEFAKRFAGRHRTVLSSMAAVGLVLGVTGTLLYQLSLKRRAYWGSPIHTEDFSNSQTWRDHWTPVEGKWEVRNGRLVTVDKHGHRLRFRRSFSGSTAVEFEGEMLPGHPMGDLSLTICSPDFNGRVHRISLQVGAYSNAFARILGPDRTTFDFSETRLEPGRRYQLRFEIDDKTLGVYVDGKRVCHYQSLFSYESYELELLGWYSGKAFDNVRIYTKGVPELAPITYAADTYYRKQYYDHAIKHYDEVIRSHPDKEIAHQAQFKKGLCYMSKGEAGKALRIWGELEGTSFEGHGVVQRFIQLSKQGNTDQLVSGFRAYYAQASRENQRQLRHYWPIFFTQARRSGDRKGRDQLLKLQQELFPDEILHHNVLSWHYREMRRYQYILDSFPTQRFNCAFALNALGRHEEVLEKYPEQYRECVRALVRLGRTAEAMRDFPGMHRFVRSDHLWRGKLKQLDKHLALRHEDFTASARRLGPPEDIIREKRGDAWLQAFAHLQLGDTDQAGKLAPDCAIIQTRILMREGRFAEALLRKDIEPSLEFRSHQRLGTLRELLAKKPNHEMKREIWKHFGETEKLLESTTNTPDVLFARGDYERAIRELKDDWASQQARYYSGKLEEALALAPTAIHLKMLRLNAQGKSNQTVESNPTSEKSQLALRQAFFHQKRYEEIISRYRDSDSWGNAMLYLGRTDEILQIFQDRHHAQIAATYMKAIDNLSHGKEAQLGLTDNHVGYQKLSGAVHHVLGPAIQAIEGESTAAIARFRAYFANKRHTQGQRIWHMVGYVLGEIGESEFLSQPCRVNANGNLILAKAIRAELTAKPQIALNHYKDYSSYPVHLKTINAVWDHFVEWRLQALK